MAFALAASLLLCNCSPTLAQPDPETPLRRQPPAGADRRGGRPQTDFQPGRAGPMLERVLTQEQRESLHTAMASQRDQMRGLQEKLRAARQALMRTSLAEKFDEDAVRAKAMEVGKLDAELAVLRAKAMSEVQPPLTEEQFERITNLPLPRQMDGPPVGPGPGPRRSHRPPPGSPELPHRPRPEPQ